MPFFVIAASRQCSQLAQGPPLELIRIILRERFCAREIDGFADRLDLPLEGGERVL
jgi:hypothetical protein